MLRWQPWLADRQNPRIERREPFVGPSLSPYFWPPVCWVRITDVCESWVHHSATFCELCRSQLLIPIVWQNPNIVHGKCSFVITSGLKSIFHPCEIMNFTWKSPRFFHQKYPKGDWHQKVPKMGWPGPLIWSQALRGEIYVDDINGGHQIYCWFHLTILMGNTISLMEF